MNLFDIDVHYEKNFHHRLENHTINLADEEIITKVEICSGWVIDSLKFVTGKGNVFGPFGGDGGGSRTISNSSKSYLHSIRGASVRTQSWLSVVDLHFEWITFS